MRLTITIDCTTDDFYPLVSREDGGHPAGSDELTALVQRVAERLSEGDESGTIYNWTGDYVVGSFSFSDTSPVQETGSDNANHHDKGELEQ